MGKKTIKANSHNVKKTQRSAPLSSDNEKIVWVFDNLDVSGEYAFNLDRISHDGNLLTVFSHMISYSSMTWVEVKRQTHDGGKSKHHFLDVSGMSDSAKSRLKFKLSDDEDDVFDSVFSFALTNRLRIVGIRQDRFFHVMWYDPEHKFYPSSK